MVSNCGEDEDLLKQRRPDNRITGSVVSENDGVVALDLGDEGFGLSAFCKSPESGSNLLALRLGDDEGHSNELR